MQWQKNLPLLCIFDASHNVYSICFALDFATLQDFFTHVETGGQSGGPLLNQLTIRKQKKKKTLALPTFVVRVRLKSTDVWGTVYGLSP